MMLAKLIGWPISTQVPSVRKPDSTTGASVKATSRTLRSTSQQQQADRDERQHARLDEGAARRCARPPGSRSAAPVASGATALHRARRSARARRCRCVGAGGDDLDARAGRPAAIQSAASSAGSVVERHRLRRRARRASGRASSSSGGDQQSRSPARARRAGRRRAGRSAAARRRASPRRRGAARAPPRAAPPRSCAAPRSSRRRSAAAPARTGLSVKSSSACALAIAASLGAWSSGTKLASVIAWPTSGSAPSRAASACAAARFGREDVDRVGRRGRDRASGRRASPSPRPWGCAGGAD